MKSTQLSDSTMQFSEWYTFDKEGIANAPQQKGVYVIRQANGKLLDLMRGKSDILYIGSTEGKKGLKKRLPWIPTELEIDQLIAGCGKKTATFLQLLKETAMRYIEAWRLKWLDVDFVRKTVNVKSAKHGKPRMLSISDKLILMLKNLSTSDSEKVFGDIGPASISVSFNHQRKRIARKLQNPRINRIIFHTLRHWKASIEYHRGMRLVELKEMLGHRNINSTMIYTHLIEGTESSDWISKVTRSVKGARALVETGFEYVKDFDDGLMLFRKRK